MPSVSRRDFIKTTTIATGSPGLLKESVRAQAERPLKQPPNVLFVLADQWRWSAFGHGSDEVVRTPHIDRLGKEGMVFERAYAANPVCTPNRSCVLTGRHSHQHGMIANNLMLPPSETCWPELFRQAGYATHYVGKWHMDGPAKPGFVPPGWRRRGFETFEGFNRGHVYHRHWGFDDHGEPLAMDVDRLPDPYYEPILQTDLAIRFMEEKKAQPFCCYLSWGPPHTPFSPPKKFERYRAEEIVHRPNVPEQHRKKAARELAGYYGLCESLDHQMGRLMSFLKQSGLEKNTLVIFSSDHGELAGSHGKYRKGEPEDESLHVPLLMRHPALIQPDSRSQALISSIDIMPTLLSLCEIDEPATCTGRNLAPVVRGDANSSVNEFLYCEGKVNSPGKESWRTIVTDRYKLIVRGDWDNVEHLVDLQNDPFEMEDLSKNSGRKKLKSELLGRLRDEANRTGDVFPQPPEQAKARYSDEEATRAQRGR